MKPLNRIKSAAFTGLFLILLFHPVDKVRAAEIDTNFRIIVEGGVGYGWTTDTLINKGTVRGGMSWVLRLMWKPDHRLSAGFETGWVHIAEHYTTNVTTIFGKTDLEAILKAMPFMAVFDMDLWGWDLYTGLGWYYVIASTKAFNEEVSTSQWNVGFYLSVSKKFQTDEPSAGRRRYQMVQRRRIGRDNTFRAAIPFLCPVGVVGLGIY